MSKINNQVTILLQGAVLEALKKRDEEIKKEAQQELIKELLEHLEANKTDLLNENMNYEDAYGEIVTAIMLKKVELNVEVEKWAKRK